MVSTNCKAIKVKQWLVVGLGKIFHPILMDLITQEVNRMACNFNLGEVKFHEISKDVNVIYFVINLKLFNTNFIRLAHLSPNLLNRLKSTLM